MTRAAQGRPGLRGTSACHGASAIQGKQILYVDDDPSIRWATSGLLQDVGVTCLLASTHDQAVTLARDEPQLALAILDFQMPDGDVGHLVERLRAARARLPLIGTSAADRRSEFAARRVSRFLEKPWELEDLLRALDNIESTLQVRGTPGSMDMDGFPVRLV